MFIGHTLTDEVKLLTAKPEIIRYHRLIASFLLHVTSWMSNFKNPIKTAHVVPMPLFCKHCSFLCKDTAVGENRVWGFSSGASQWEKCGSAPTRWRRKWGCVWRARGPRRSLCTCPGPWLLGGWRVCLLHSSRCWGLCALGVTRVSVQVAGAGEAASWCPDLGPSSPPLPPDGREGCWPPCGLKILQGGLLATCDARREVGMGMRAQCGRGTESPWAPGGPGWRVQPEEPGKGGGLVPLLGQHHDLCPVLAQSLGLPGGRLE